MGTALPYSIWNPNLNARDYYLDLQKAIHANPHVFQSDMKFEEIDTNECYVRGVLMLMDGFELHVAEYVITFPTLSRPKYRYHLQTSEGILVSRWDNAPHHSEMSSFPDHRHDEKGVHPSTPMSIPDVLGVLLKFI